MLTSIPTKLQKPPGPKRTMSESYRTNSLSKSLRLPTSQPVHFPIPPSLVESPYLNSPHSIFRQSIIVPREPSREDEEWLQDTVPLAGGMIASSSSSGVLSPSGSYDNAEASRKRTSSHKTSSPMSKTTWVSLPDAPPSPPLTRSRQSKSRPDQPRHHSDSFAVSAARGSYFVDSPIRT